MIDIFLPRTDGGVLVQVVATLIASPATLFVLIRKGKRDYAWLAGGIITMWAAFLAVRTLH